MENSMDSMLVYVLIFMIVILVILVTILIILTTKEKMDIKNTKNKSKIRDKNANNKDVKPVAMEYSKESIFSFMEFDEIDNNMIVQKNGKRFLMVVECQGINYDLMSGVEKTSVEQGFLQFLNTLRHPIQIYVQTRTVNLNESINTYKQKIKIIRDKLTKTELNYRDKVNSRRYTEEEMQKDKLDVIKERNLYEYGLDIIGNTEQMSFNRNILTKRYYVVIPFYTDEIENHNYDKDEIKNIAFSELYTKAQSIISALYVCGIKCKVLDSVELMELLYVAYNRDESEVYNLNKVLNSGYEDIYSTAPDVLERKIIELEKQIKEEANRKANQVVFQAKEESEKEREVREKEEKMDELINNMAKIIIEENARFLGQDVVDKAKEKLDKEQQINEKGGEHNEKETEVKRKPGRPRKIN